MWRVAEFGVARLVVCLVAAAPGCARETTPAAPSEASAAASAPGTLRDRPDHVVIVVLENKDEQDVVREAPYLAALAGRGRP
jgi:hypothetical protein